MNKQKLIEYCEYLKGDLNKFINGIDVNKIIKMIEQLDEPQKVTIPQFVADYIKDAKYYEWGLDDVFDHIAEESEESEIYKWFYTLGNIDVFARAWLDGYEIEEEKRYRVSLKNGQPLLKAILGKTLYFSQDIAIESYKVTRKELEEAGFGWVLDCPGVEVEEVTE